MRNKSFTGLLMDMDRETEQIIEDFKEFMSGTRVLLLLWRQKAGGGNNEYRRRRAREVVHDMDQMRKAIKKLLILQATADADMRIYMSASPRDIRKAEIEFKEQMLNMDAVGGENKKFFYENLEEKWVSCLMSANPMNGTNLFLLDVDEKDNSKHLKWCADNQIEIVKVYATVSGWHIIVKPFNRKIYPKELGDCKPDALILLAK